MRRVDVLPLSPQELLVVHRNLLKTPGIHGNGNISGTLSCEVCDIQKDIFEEK